MNVEMNAHDAWNTFQTSRNRHVYDCPVCRALNTPNTTFLQRLFYVCDACDFVAPMDENPASKSQTFYCVKKTL